MESVRTDVEIRPSLEQELRRRVDGEVRFDVGSRAAYAIDSSNYRQVPLAVVVPRTVDDAVAAVAVCAERGVPVLSRGGGTSLAGQTTNRAVVLDWTKYCHHLVSVDADARACVVEPGIALDELNRQLARYDLMFGPKPSTHRSCTLGGMIGNNSCGSTAQAYGKTADNVTRLEVLTYDGLRMWVGPTSDQEYADILAAGGRRAEIYRSLRELRDDNLALIRTRYPHIPRRVSGLQPRLAAAGEPLRPRPRPGRLRGDPGHRPARRARARPRAPGQGDGGARLPRRRRRRGRRAHRSCRTSRGSSRGWTRS